MAFLLLGARPGGQRAEGLRRSPELAPSCRRPERGSRESGGLPAAGVSSSHHMTAQLFRNLLHHFFERFLCPAVWGSIFERLRSRVSLLICIAVPCCSHHAWGSSENLPHMP